MVKVSNGIRYAEFGFNDVIYDLISEEDKDKNLDEIKEFHDFVVSTKVKLKKKIVKLLGLPKKDYIPDVDEDGVYNLSEIKRLTFSNMKMVRKDTTKISWKDNVDVETDVFKIRFTSLLLIYIANNIDIMAIMLTENRGKNKIESISNYDEYIDSVEDISDCAISFMSKYLNGEAYGGTLFQLFCYCNYADENIPRPKKYNKYLHGRIWDLRYLLDNYSDRKMFGTVNTDDIIMDFIAKIGISCIKYDKDPAAGIYKYLPSLVPSAPISIAGKHFDDNTSNYLNAIGRTMYKLIESSSENYFYLGIFMFAKPYIKCGYLRESERKLNLKAFKNIQEACYVLEYMKVMIGYDKLSEIIDQILKKEYV